MSTATANSELSSLHPRILCVDDEPHVLAGLRTTLRRHFDVRLATSGPDGLTMLREEPDKYAIVISDMRMPVMNGANFLRESRMIAPDAVRILLTGYADLDSAIKVVNEARLFRFLTKPCESTELMQACAAALHQHRLQTAERTVLEQTVRGSVDILADVLALTNPAAFGRGNRLKVLAGALARALKLPNVWEVEVAAMLADIGAVTLPQATAEKVYAGLELTDQETAMVERIPTVTRRLLSKIPRLEGVLEILERAQTVGSASERGRTLNPGAEVIRFAADYAELESQGATESVAIGALRGRGIHNLKLLDEAARVIGVSGGSVVREVRLAELEPGMMLADDVRTVEGQLLVARGAHVSDQLIERLANLTAERVRQPILVFGHTEAS